MASASSSSSSPFLQRAWAWYRAQLTQKPLRTQVVTSGILWASGDLIAQSIERHLSPPRSPPPSPPSLHPSEERRSSKKEIELPPIDWRRASLCSSFGVFFVGPFGHLWYEGLEHLVRHRFKLRPNSIKFIGCKVLMDCFIFGPIHLVAFFSYMSLSSGRTLELLKEDLRRDFVPAFMVDGAIWPVVQIVNFRFLPVQHQLLFVNMFCIADSAFLSWFKHQENAPWKRWLASLLVKEKPPPVASS